MRQEKAKSKLLCKSQKRAAGIPDMGKTTQRCIRSIFRIGGFQSAISLYNGIERNFHCDRILMDRTD